MGFINEIGTISSIQRTKYKVIYWKIDGFSTFSQSITEDNYYTSPSSRFTFNNLKDCWLRFYPNGASIKPGFIDLSFNSRNHVVNSLYHLTLGVKTQSERIDKWFSSYIFLQFKGEMRFPSFKLKSEFLKRKEELVPSDCLTFVVFLSSEEVNIVRDVEDKTEACNLKEEGEEEKKGGEKALGDMAKLLASGDRSDFIIVVGESEYKVHSCILAARAPVFAALFEHDTLEKSTRKITINDCEPGVFAEFLHFIYTGSVQNLFDKNAAGLYRVSDKYLINDLKELCREHIRDNLCAKTFCDTVRLALTYKDEDLLESAFDYFEINIRHIIRSVEWQQYIEENPREANEILIRSLGPP